MFRELRPEETMTLLPSSLVELQLYCNLNMTNQGLVKGRSPELILCDFLELLPKPCAIQTICTSRLPSDPRGNLRRAYLKDQMWLAARSSLEKACFVRGIDLVLLEEDEI